METSSALDPTLVERLRKYFCEPYKILKELRDSPRPEELLQEWGEAPEPSEEWRQGVFFGNAVLVLSAALGLSREETEALVNEYIAEEPSTDYTPLTVQGILVAMSHLLYILAPRSQGRRSKPRSPGKPPGTRRRAPVGCHQRIGTEGRTVRGRVPNDPCLRGGQPGALRSVACVRRTYSGPGDVVCSGVTRLRRLS